MSDSQSVTSESWKAILAVAYRLFDDLAGKGFPDPPFTLGGGTVLMFHFKHRLSKDIDLFGYDAQWLSLLSPRLNDAANAMASHYSEQANTIKIVLPEGDIDFIVAGDVAVPVVRRTMRLEGRPIDVDPVSEVLAKKLFYRAATLKPRDVYDLSTALDLDPDAARQAMAAAASKRAILLARLEDLNTFGKAELLRDIVPYDGDTLRHADAMVAKVRDAIAATA